MTNETQTTVEEKKESTKLIKLLRWFSVQVTVALFLIFTIGNLTSSWYFFRYFSFIKSENIASTGTYKYTLLGLLISLVVLGVLAVPYMRKILITHQDKQEQSSRRAMVIMVSIICIFNILLYGAVRFPNSDALRFMASDTVLFKDIDSEIISVHEAGHCLVTMVEFKDKEDYQTTELRLFSEDDMTKALRFLGDSYTDIPYGVHRANRYAFLLKDNIIKYLRITLAGMAAEEVMFGHNELGVYGDLNSATDIVKGLVDSGGSSLGPIQWEMLSPEEKSRVYKEIVMPEYGAVKKIIEENKDKVLDLSKALQEKKVLYRDDIKKILQLDSK